MTFSQGNQAAFKKRTLLPRSKVSRDRRRNLSKLRKYHLDQFIANKKQLPIGDVYGLPWDKNDCVTISVVMALFPWIKKAPDFSKPITIVDKYVLFEGDHCPDLTDKNWAANGINTTIQMAVEFLYKHQLLISGQYCLINHDKPCCCAKFNHHPHVLIVPVNLSGNRGSRSQYIKECLNETYEHNGKTYALFAATFWSVNGGSYSAAIYNGYRKGNASFFVRLVNDSTKLINLDKHTELLFILICFVIFRDCGKSDFQEVALRIALGIEFTYSMY